MIVLLIILVLWLTFCAILCWKFSGPHAQNLTIGQPYTRIEG